ncbi:MAG: DUF5990 family protein [Pseudomonadales bacterium]|jgi:hypothetical protein|nr:DUF5990 family protein [Pseudomonadales bacterium]HJN51868.1 DUF5990 family protein [Pseudomonadales bacterium]|tara:strand:- start:137 stop:442 length:306 start_codon:yes stop_codon:yes gene_type:complete
MDQTPALRIVLLDPPVGFAFCLQTGKGAGSTRLDYVISEGGDLSFELEITAREKAGMANFVGPFAQGTADARFFYICVGKSLEQDEPMWSGRVKVPLASIG